MRPNHLNRSPLRALIGCLLLATCAPFPASAQQPANSEPGSDRAILQALLVEMRQLRVALERSTMLVPRLQLAISRYQMQQERVDRLERDLRNFRVQLATDSSAKDRMAVALKQMEEQSTQAQDPIQRKQMEEAARNTKMELEQQAAREQQSRGQEIEMSNQLRAEEAKLNDLTEQINQLDRKLQQQ